MDVAAARAIAFVGLIVAISSVYFLVKKCTPKETDKIETRKSRVFARRVSWAVSVVWLEALILHIFVVRPMIIETVVVVTGLLCGSLLFGRYFSTVPSQGSRFGRDDSEIIEILFLFAWFFIVGIFFLMWVWVFLAVIAEVVLGIDTPYIYRVSG